MPRVADLACTVGLSGCTQHVCVRVCVDALGGPRAKCARPWGVTAYQPVPTVAPEVQETV